MPRELLALDAGDQFVDGGGIFVAGGGDADAHGVKLDALLGDLGDVGVGLEAERIIIELVYVVDVEAGDDGVDADAEVGVVELAKGAVVGLELLEVARDAADVVVLVAHAIEGEVDDELGVGASLAHGSHFGLDNLVHQAVGGDVDDAGVAVLVDGLGGLYDVLVHEGLAAADGEPEGGIAHALEGFVPFFEGELVFALHPDVACEAARVAARRGADGDAHGEHLGPAEFAVHHIEGYFAKCF